MSAIQIFPIINLAFGLVAIPWYIKLARQKNLIDMPNHRSSHTIPTPRGGGIFLVAGCLLLSLVDSVLNDRIRAFLPFLATGTGIALLGFIDDIKSLPSKLRLVIQLLLAAILISFLLRSLQFAFLLENRSIITQLAIVTLSVVWLVGCLNIYNFMDGIDGIATAQGIAAASVWGYIGYASNLPIILNFSLLLISGLLAFLVFNWSPAKVFMGDCASSFLGFSFAALPLLYASLGSTDSWLALNLGAIALFPFLFDGAFTLFRRAYSILRSANFAPQSFARLGALTEAHRSHLYQRWNQNGKSHRFVTSAYLGWAMLCASLSVLLYHSILPLWVAWILASLPAATLVYHSRSFPSNRSAT